MTIRDRLLAKIFVQPDGCWTWQGAAQPSGYGQLWNGTRPEQAHRLSYKLFCGPIPENVEVDHVCRVRGCVNPQHLRLLSHRDNMLVGETGPARNAAKTHCDYGHELAGRNLRIATNGSRQCRLCVARRAREAKARRKARAKSVV